MHGAHPVRTRADVDLAGEQSNRNSKRITCCKGDYDRAIKELRSRRSNLNPTTLRPSTIRGNAFQPQSAASTAQSKTTAKATRLPARLRYAPSTIHWHHLQPRQGRVQPRRSRTMTRRMAAGKRISQKPSTIAEFPASITKATMSTPSAISSRRLRPAGFLRSLQQSRNRFYNDKGSDYDRAVFLISSQENTASNRIILKLSTIVAPPTTASISTIARSRTTTRRYDSNPITLKPSIIAATRTIAWVNTTVPFWTMTRQCALNRISSKRGQIAPPPTPEEASTRAPIQRRHPQNFDRIQGGGGCGCWISSNPDKIVT